MNETSHDERVDRRDNPRKRRYTSHAQILELIFKTRERADVGFKEADALELKAKAILNDKAAVGQSAEKPLWLYKDLMQQADRIRKAADRMLNARIPALQAKLNEIDTMLLPGMGDDTSIPVRVRPETMKLREAFSAPNS